MNPHPVPAGVLVRARSLRERVPVEAGETLYVSLDLGAVDVESHEREEVEIEAGALDESGARAHFSLERDGRELWLDGGIDGWPLALLDPPRVRVRVRVPREFAVDVRTGAGHVRLAHLRGRIAGETRFGSVEAHQLQGQALLRSFAGTVSVADLRGDLRARASGGSVVIERAEGRIEARALAGRIELREVGGWLDAHAAGGSLFASLRAAPAGRLEAYGGAIEVWLPRGCGLRLDASARGGRIRLDPELVVDGEVSPERISGVLGGGGERLELRAAGGGVRVRAAQPTSAESAAIG